MPARPRGGGLAARTSASSGTSSTGARPALAGLELGAVALVGERSGAGRATSRRSAQVLGAQLLGARQHDGADAEAGDHRAAPTRAGCRSASCTTSPAPDAARGERPGQPRRAVGDLAEGPLAPRAVARQLDERQRAPRAAASTTSRAKFMPGCERTIWVQTKFAASRASVGDPHLPDLRAPPDVQRAAASASSTSPWRPAAKTLRLQLDGREVVAGSSMAHRAPGGDGVGERDPDAAVDVAAGMQVAAVDRHPAADRPRRRMLGESRCRDRRGTSRPGAAATARA